MFLAVGLLIHFQDIPTYYPPYKPTAWTTVVYIVNYFIASILGGLAIPFMVINWYSKRMVNLSGLLAILLIILMFGIAAAYSWDIPWLYFIAAIVLYASVSVVLNLDLNSEDSDRYKPMFKDHRFTMGSHLAFIFLLVGFWLHSNNVAVYISFFLGGIAGGLIIPYLVVRGNPKS